MTKKQPISNEMFQPLPKDSLNHEAINRPSLTFWQDAWRRLKQNKVAMGSMIILVIILLMSIFGPMMNKHDFSTQNYDALRVKPTLENQYYFGTDDLGRDMWTRVWSGARLSLFIGFVAAGLDLIIGVLYGSVSGFLGGRTDTIMMRIIEILNGIPNLILIILMVMVLKPGVTAIIIAIAMTGWVGMARVVRGQVLSLKSREFVLAARTLGANTQWMLFKHLIPNMMGPILVLVSMTIPGAIFSEATLSFIGLGIPVPNASLGSLTSEGRNWLLVAPHILFFPAILISLVLLVFSLFGDGLRDALDPKMRK